MWEFSLFFPRELMCYFEDLKLELKTILCFEKNCVGISSINDHYVFMLALTKETYSKNILFIKERIAEIILLYYKPKSIINSIDNFDLSVHENVLLLDILSSFEFYEDRDEIVKKMSLLDKLYLNSFVKFKLTNLINKWQEISGLINQNSLFMLDSKIKKELMQFLMEGIVSRAHHIKLLQNGKNIEIVDVADNQVKKIKCCRIYYSIFDYDNLLFSLIKQYPKILEVEHYKNFDIALIQNLSDLFGMRLKLVE